MHSDAGESERVWFEWSTAHVRNAEHGQAQACTECHRRARVWLLRWRSPLLSLHGWPRSARDRTRPLGLCLTLSLLFCHSSLPTQLSCDEQHAHHSHAHTTDVDSTTRRITPLSSRRHNEGGEQRSETGQAQGLPPHTPHPRTHHTQRSIIPFHDYLCMSLCMHHCEHARPRIAARILSPHQWFVRGSSGLSAFWFSLSLFAFTPLAVPLCPFSRRHDDVPSGLLRASRSRCCGAICRYQGGAKRCRAPHPAASRPQHR